MHVDFRNKNLPRPLITLRERCLQPADEIFALLEENGGVIHNGYDRHGFLDRGSNILAVAHLDFAGKNTSFDFDPIGEDDLKIICQSLDDRLGVFTILDCLPRLGISVDVLLTENEEFGLSTAASFTPYKKYNWMVGFDRRGTDTVTYQYNWKGILKDYFRSGVGTYSDIVDLDHLGCLGLNVGIGYYNEHTPKCHAIISKWFSQLNRFIKFYFDHKDIPYRWT